MLLNFRVNEDATKVPVLRIAFYLIKWFSVSGVDEIKHFIINPLIYKFFGS